MRILAISDEVVAVLNSPRVAYTIGAVDLLLSCGDLPYSYMEYLVTVLPVKRAGFVHGNHDTFEYVSDGRVLDAPGGWSNLDGVVEPLDGLLVAGLEGCLRYKSPAAYQYSQAQMRLRVLRLLPGLLLNRIRYGRYLDILITHAPPLGIHDGQDLPHQGFAAFLWLLRAFHPLLHLHGHRHRYGRGTWRTRYAATEVVNIQPYQIIRLDHGRIYYERSSPTSGCAAAEPGSQL